MQSAAASALGYIQAPHGILLSGAQAIKVHGWMSPSRRLEWRTVKARDDLTFSRLVGIIAWAGTEKNYTKALDALHSLQPSFKEWLISGKVKLADCEAMHSRWQINIADDFGIRQAGVGEILEVQLSSACLKGCNLDVDGLFRLGMTRDTMALFRFSLDEWIGLLGLRKEHLQGMSEAQLCAAWRWRMPRMEDCSDDEFTTAEAPEAVLMTERFIDDYYRGYWIEFTGPHILEVCENLMMSLPPGQYDNTTRAGRAWLGVGKVMSLVLAQERARERAASANGTTTPAIRWPASAT